MPRLLRMVIVLLLTTSLTTAVLAAPLSGALPRRSAVTAPSSMRFLAQIWSLLSQLWPKNGSEADPNGAWIKNGSQVDPSGNPLPPSNSTTTGDNGSQMDPDGVH